MNRKLRTVGCFVEYENKFIILRRNANKTYANDWGLPAGKLKSGETDEQAVIRETFEETGIKIDAEKVKLLDNFEFHFAQLDLTFPTFRIRLPNKPEVKINPKEHSDYKWVTAEECYKIPNLIEGLHDLLKRVGYIS